MDLEEKTRIASGPIVDRDDRLDRELHRAAGPDEAGIDRAGERRGAAVDPLLQVELDQRNHLVERLAPTKGRRYFALSGRSPNPLPTKIAGVQVLNDSAPTLLCPEPPMSQSTPTEAIASRASFL